MGHSVFRRANEIAVSVQPPPSMAIICFLIQQDGARISSHYNRTTVGRNCSKLRRTLVSLQQCTRNTTGNRPAINVSLTQIPAVL